MRLHGICYYRSKSETWTGKWRQTDWAALNLVKAIKDKTFNSSSTLAIKGVDYVIDSTPAGKARAMLLVSSSLAKKISNAGYKRAVIVPIPSSAHTDPNAMFTGRRIAEAIQAKNPAFVSTPILYFNEALPKSAGGGGTRNAHAIQQHLRLVNGNLPNKVVLLDDVCTTGGHLKAAARFLAQHGVDVQDAFVVGRTAWEQPESMFAVQPEDIQTADLFDF